MTLVASKLTVKRSGRLVLDGVDVEIGSGDLVAVIGANGAGKSTLLKALAGVLPPAAGAVLLEQRVLPEWGLSALGTRVAYLPQERTVHWPLSVRATAELGRLPHVRGRALGVRDHASVDRALAAMDVADLAHRPVTELSGGELARVLMARALAQDPTYLLADEPTAGLDPAHQIALFERLAELAKSGGAVVVALHDLSLAARFCRRIVLLKTGRCLADGAPGDVLTPSRLADAYGIRAVMHTIEGVPVVVPVSIVR